MAVIRCQSCGKPNPEFLENCQYCESRLKPMVGASPEDTLIRPASGTIRCQACGRANPEANELCQFCEARLRPMVANAPAPTPAAQSPAAEEADADPLARLRSTQIFEPTPSEPEPAAEEAPAEPGPADWMSRLRGVSTPAAGDETIVPGSHVAAEPEPDWMFTEAANAAAEESLGRLREEPPPPADAPRAANDDDLPDWLANLRSTAATPPAPAPLPPAPAEPPSLPPLPHIPTPLEEPPAPPAPPADELPDWLKFDDTTPPAKVSLSQRPRKKMTDWLNELPAAGTPEAAAPEAFTAQAPVPPASEAPAPEEGPSAPAAPAGSAPEAPQPADQTLVPPPRRKKKMTDWLTPPEGGLPAPVQAPRPTEPEAELPDWLKAMQPVEEVPDWLRDVASAPRVFNRPSIPTETTDQPAASAESATPAAADIGLPDWLKDIQTKSEPAAPAATPPAETPAPPEPPKMRTWANTPAPSASPAAPAPGEAKPAEEADLPDWLKAMRASTAAAAPPEVDAPSRDPLPAARRQQELPAWLKGATSLLPPEPEPPAPAAAAPTESTPEAEAPQAEAPLTAPDLPWLQPASEDEPEPETEAPAAQPGDYELPDWLRPSPEAMAAAEAELAAEPPVDMAAINAAELARAEEDLPDWLRNLPAPSAETADPAAEAEATRPDYQPDPDVPDWLRPAGPLASPPEPSDDALAPAEIPDWLQTIQSGAASPTLPTAEQAADLPPLDDETLAWLTASATATNAAAAAEPEAAAGPLGEAGQADWLDQFKTVSEVAPEATEMDAVPAGEGGPSAEPTAVEDMPDWLKALRGVPTPEQQTAEAMPDWLRALRGIPPRSTTEITASPEPEARPARVARPETQPAGEGEGDLPAWLSAMRPTDVEHPADAEVDSYEENVGVLAGMRGVLRAEPTAAQPHKSTAPVQQLVVAETHAAQAKVLTSMLAEEEPARPIAAAKPARLAQYLERWFVFLVLGLAIIIPQFVLPTLFAVPTTMSPAAENAFNTVSLAPMNQPALVAFDYDPAQQGELNPGAVALITHLMSRGVPVVSVSTRPLGAAVAHNVLEQVAADLGNRAQVSYTYGSQYLNLGYIPGGPVGLVQFAAAPRSVFQADFTGAGPGSALWTQPILRGVEGLSDFGLVLLVSANPDDARAWIEQSQLYAAGIPRLAVVSAGAQPMMQPYMEGEAPQLAGLVAGLAGAAQYEQHAGLPGQASRNWGALGGGLWAAVVLIAGGNAVYATAALLRRRRR